MLYTSTTLAVFGLATLGRSHMIMTTPVPYGKSTLNNSPLDATGADFPCKQRSGVYDAEGASNAMTLGSTQKLAFEGSATHGGGSCQVSVTYDEAPTANSTWKVIHSIEGGCPIIGQAGNIGDDASEVDPDTYAFTVPTTLPTGNATMAWTWFNKVGNREMYMNCAPVTLSAASSKRSDELIERDTTAFDALPDMFVANVGNGCATKDSTDLVFPNPGDSLELLGTATSSALAGPTGSCQAAVAGESGTPSAGSVATSAAGGSAASSAVSGGVFATVTSAPAAATTAAAPSVASAQASTPVVSSATAAGTGTTSTGSGSAITAGTACTTEGEYNCIGGTSYQECASGEWSVVMDLAAGTQCTSGMSSSINITAVSSKNKRSVRFSNQHLRRHIQRSL